MPAPPRSALFLCTGNSARSMLAECLLERWGGEGFRAFSAGSRPVGAPNPFALALLREQGYDVSGLRSKSWDEFSGPGAPELDFVFTVCDAAAGETCPIWRNAPVVAHWGVADPAAVRGSEREVAVAFRRAYDELERRIRRFVALPLDALGPEKLSRRLAEIGRDARADADVAP